MKYIKLKQIPAPLTAQEKEKVYAPAAILAARLGRNDMLEYRIASEKSGISIYIGIERHRLDARNSLLENFGYITEQITPPPLPLCEKIFVRKIDRQLTFNHVQNKRNQLFLPSDITPPDSTLFATLAAHPGTSIVIYISKSERLTRDINALLTQADSIKAKELSDSNLYNFVFCLSSSKEAAYGLSSEIEANTNLHRQPIEAFYPSEATVFKVCDGIISGADIERKLAKTITENELYCLLKIPIQPMGDYTPVFNKNLFTIPHSSNPFLVQQDVSFKLGENNGKGVYLNEDRILRHTFVCAGSGGGKSNLIMEAIIAADMQNIPVIAIEAGKKELHHLGKVIDNFNLYTASPGNMALNIFDFDSVRAENLGKFKFTLKSALRLFKNESSLEEWFDEAVNNIYHKFRYYDTDTSWKAGRMFTMSDFIRCFQELLNSAYSKDTSSDMRTAGAIRLKRFIAQNPAVFDSTISTPMECFTKGVNILQLADMGVAEKQAFASIFLIYLSSYINNNFGHSSNKLKLLVVIDESHLVMNCVSDSDGRNYSFSRDFTALLKLLRSVGVGFIIGNQDEHLPAEIIDNCGTKIFLNGKDMKTYYEYDKETEKILIENIGIGEGFIISRGLSAPLFFAGENVIDLIVNDKDYKCTNRFANENPRLLCENQRFCIYCPGKGRCNMNIRLKAMAAADCVYSDYRAILKSCTSEQSKESAKQLTATLNMMFASVDSFADSETFFWCGVLFLGKKLTENYKFNWDNYIQLAQLYLNEVKK